jgi:uncharacterized membrane protein
VAPSGLHYFPVTLPFLLLLLALLGLVVGMAAMRLLRYASVSMGISLPSLGTLIGADLLNLDKIQGLGAPVASIGGAGTFDGIFVTGLLAVLYAGLVRYAR